MLGRIGGLAAWPSETARASNRAMPPNFLLQKIAESAAWPFAIATQMVVPSVGALAPPPAGWRGMVRPDRKAMGGTLMRLAFIERDDRKRGSYRSKSFSGFSIAFAQIS